MEGFDIEVYMQTIKQELLNTFGDELVYLGLQGSFAEEKQGRAAILMLWSFWKSLLSKEWQNTVRF